MTMTTTMTTMSTTTPVTFFQLALVFLVSLSTLTKSAYAVRGGGLRKTRHDHDDSQQRQRQRQLPAISNPGGGGGSMTSLGGQTRERIRASTLLGGGLFSGNTHTHPFLPNDSDNNNDHDHVNLISCTPNQLAAQARVDVHDQFFTYEGRLDFTDYTVGDVLQLAVFFAYRDEVVCHGEEQGAQLELDSNFFMFGHDHQDLSAPSASSSLPDGVNIDRSFFLMTFNLACNACPILQEGCGMAVFSDDNMVAEEHDSTITTTTCSCTPPTREVFLNNLNERLQQDNYLGLFDGVVVTDVMDIVVTPSPPLQQGENNNDVVVSRNTPGLGLEWPLLVRPAPAGCVPSSPTQDGGPFAGLVTAASTSHQQDVDCTTPAVKIEDGVPTLLCE